MSIYNAIQKGTVGVKDSALCKGPHMAALKLAAAVAGKSIRAQRKEGETGVVGGVR